MALMICEPQASPISDAITPIVKVRRRRSVRAKNWDGSSTPAPLPGYALLGIVRNGAGRLGIVQRC